MKAQKRAVRVLSVLVCLFFAGNYGQLIAQSKSVPLTWLEDNSFETDIGVSWGVPFTKGEVQPGDTFSLTDNTGTKIPVQNWPMAYWPDGSIKWTGLAAVVPPSSGNGFQLSVGTSATSESLVLAQETKAGIEINTGVIQAIIPKNGSSFLSSLKINGQQVGKNGQLIAINEDRSRLESEGILEQKRFVSRIQEVTLEQSGPVRAVVKVEGSHVAPKSDREWLPFVVRLYFYAGQSSVKMVHSFVFDGDQKEDFIKGLGVEFSVPMREQTHNRWAKFTGDTGLFSEPAQLIAGRRPNDEGIYSRHVSGNTVANKEELPNGKLIDDLAIWNDFKLTQLNDGAYTISKRTGQEGAWVKSARGERSSGMVFTGDTKGGLAVSMRNFWELSPTQLQVTDLEKEEAKLMVWLWSPDAPAMDLRHYDTKGHGLSASYEDYEEGFSKAHGVARTTEITLMAFNHLPDNESLLKLEDTFSNPPRLVSTPEYYYSTNTFGYWSLPDRSNPVKRKLEDQLDMMFSFYKNQAEEHRWYGFWDYGDIMHTYDPFRNTWKYDVGGFAWMNSEECPDVWLWYSFLRKGRADIFKMAEAMTRHTQEVDVYHLGRFAGLGSRHNVRHWGDSAKELRISQALLKRFYYYLTTDERTGDLLTQVKDADYALLEVDPLRKILPKSPYPTHIRSGPDWLAAAGNWMTEWERTGNTKYRDKIKTGMKALANMPDGLLTSISFGYDPETGMLYDDPDQRLPVGQFVMIMGGAEVAFELETLLDLPEFWEVWLELCEEWARTGGGDMAAPRAIAYAAYKKNDAELGRLAWQQMFKEGGDGTGLIRFPEKFDRVNEAGVPYPTDEIPKYMATGHLSQWALNVIGTLELAGKWIPELEEVEAGEYDGK
ncbi:hypothetical protein SAMN06265219_104123 [Gracilimonas mengyeensis]|uniref:Tat pathway signal sequence domain protein n=2 Tax=Gracilimonas mengyeensis TaxID=1302730 RepID=A0A521C3A1_9BACT|nr:hypothetical protein SAMN06265219_104123 [Gracilimonas mengyeensis]